MRFANPKNWLWLISLGGSILIWQLVSVNLNDRPFPSASKISNALWAMLQTGEFWGDLGVTFLIAMVGLIIGIVLAVPLGLLVGLNEFAFRSTKFILDFLKVIPPIVVLPLVLLMFGTTIKFSVTLVVFGVLFSVIVQATYGVRDTDPVLLDTLSAFNASKYARLKYAVLPSALPFIATGTKIATSAAVIVSIVTGLVGSGPGLGHSLSVAETGGNFPNVYAYVVVLGVVGILVNMLVSAIDKRIIFWRGK